MLHVFLLIYSHRFTYSLSTSCGFGGLGVACWPLVPKFAGSNPAEKILSTPSFGGEVKLLVLCRRFAACKRSEFRQNYWISFSPTVPSFTARISRFVANVRAPGGESGNVERRGKQWQTTPKNLSRLHCARATPVTWLGSGSCQGGL